MPANLLLSLKLTIFSLFFAINVFAQNKKLVDVTFTVKDSKTLEPLSKCGIYFSGHAMVVETNDAGVATIQLEKTSFNITVRNLAYKLKTLKIDLNDSNNNFEVLLVENILELQAVDISAEKKGANVQKATMGIEKLSNRTMKLMPKLMGEADVIRNILMLPGVNTIGEGASGFNVRGGNVDQNQILLDGVPIQNSSHLFGFFTAFNSGLIQDVSLHKSGISAEYGGKASSILNVNLKEGDFEKWNFEAGTGLIMSNLMVNGPLIKNKTAILFGARGSFSDFYLKYFPNQNLKQSRANFYDVNFKITHRINNKQKLTFGFYQSKDSFKFASDTLYFWKTDNLYLNHSALLTKRFSVLTAIYQSVYKYGLNGLTKNFEFNWQPEITQQTIKQDYLYEIHDASKLIFGGEFSKIRNNQGDFLPNAPNSIINPFLMQKENTRELAVYAGYSNALLNNKFRYDLGLRYSHYTLLGPLNVYKYGDGPKDNATITDTLSYHSGDKICSYGGFEPRISFGYQLGKWSSIKLGFNRMRQYRHLLSNTMAVSPVDLWKNSNQYIPPQVADQFSIGYFHNFEPNQDSYYESSVEFYYKKIPSLIDYIDGASLFLNPTIENQLLVGKGNAYGAEFYIKKVKGIRLTGWVSYTYSRAFRIVEANANQVSANFGVKFPANFDTPHSFKSVINFQCSKKISLNSTFTFNSGRPITFPNGKYKLYDFNEVFDYMAANGLNPRPGKTVTTYSYGGRTFIYLTDGTIEEIIDGYATPSFTLRNAFRIPAYVRLDLSLNYEATKKGRYQSSFSFGIYNILGRQNVYSIYFKSDTGLRNQAKTYKMSILGVAIPSITYSIKF